MQSRKISNQADYFLVHDDTQREEMFEDWCAMKVAQLPEDESEAEDDDYEPTKYHYLSEIMYQLRDEINADTVADDILRGHRPLFKQYHIKQFIPDRRELRAVVSRLLFYYKRFTARERRAVFHDYVSQRYGLLPGEDVDNDDAGSLSGEQMETRILQWERDRQTEGNSSWDPTALEYYVVGLREKYIGLRLKPPATAAELQLRTDSH